MNAATIRVFRGRPPIVEARGTRFFVSVHDAWYLEERTRHLERLKAAHPDRGGTTAKLMQAKRAYDRWRLEEGRWYDAIGLEPPRAGHPSGRRRLKQSSGTLRLFRVLSDLQPHRRSELSAAAGIPVRDVGVYLKRLKARGYAIQRYTERQQVFVRLLAAPDEEML